MRRATFAAGLLLVLAGCATSNTGVVVGGVEGPKAPTVSANAEPAETIVAWAPPSTTVPAPTTTAGPETPESWNEYDAAVGPVLSVFAEDGTIGLTAADVERGSELIGSLKEIKNALPFDAPVTVGVVSVRKLRDIECVQSGNQAPCALVSWVVKSQGNVVSAPFNMTVVKLGEEWKLSARNACGLLRYFRTPCPIEFPLTPNEIALGATSVPTTKP